jgi:hypothetical protein
LCYLTRVIKIWRSLYLPTDMFKNVKPLCQTPLDSVYHLIYNMLKDKENRKCNLNNEPESTSIFVRLLVNIVHWKNISCPVLV